MFASASTYKEPSKKLSGLNGSDIFPLERFAFLYGQRAFLSPQLIQEDKVALF